MGAATTYKKAYGAAEVETLSQRDILVKLFQGAERFLVQAQLAIHNRQVEMAHTNCQKARAIFVELLSTLNFEQGGEIAIQLRDLYVFLIGQITEANLRKDAAKLSALLPTIATLREAWEQIPDEHARTSSLRTGDGSTFSTTT